MKRILFLALILPFFIACNDSDDDVQPSIIKMGTIYNPTMSTNFKFKQDDNLFLFEVLESDVKYYRPKNEQRAILEYVYLPHPAHLSSLPNRVKLLDVYEVLTKGIFNITASTQDSIGNDAINIKDMWITNDFLNVEFAYPGYSKTHFINLVKDDSKTYTDGKVHLEFRHNANNDYPSYNISGIVSFNLKSLRVNGSTSVNFVVHTKEFSYDTTDKAYDFTYKYNTSAAMMPERAISIPARKASVK